MFFEDEPKQEEKWHINGAFNRRNLVLVDSHAIRSHQVARIRLVSFHRIAEVPISADG